MMGRVFPRENNRLEFVPCNTFTRSTSFLEARAPVSDAPALAGAGALEGFAPSDADCCASVLAGAIVPAIAIVAAPLPAALRKSRLLVIFTVSICFPIEQLSGKVAAPGEIPVNELPVRQAAFLPEEKL